MEGLKRTYIKDDFKLEHYGSDEYKFDYLLIRKYLGSSSVVTIPPLIDGIFLLSIGKMSFKDNKYLEEINFLCLPPIIGTSAFEGCTNLKRINIFNSPKGSHYTIKKDAFKGCDEIEINFFNADKND